MSLDLICLTDLLEGDMFPANMSPLPMLIHTLQTPEQAGPDDVIMLMEPRWFTVVLKSQAGVCICAQSLWAALSLGEREQLLAHKHVVLVKQARAAFVKLLQHFYPRQERVPGVHERAVIETPHCHPLSRIEAFAYVGENARLGEGCWVGAHASIGRNVLMGRDCRIGERVVLCEGVVLGDRVVIQPGAVIGADGYGFYQQAPGQAHQKIPQVGSVVIEDDVEIGANVTIDRGTLGNTVIGEGTKIDNLVQIGHNVQVGKRCLLVAQVGISGSTQIGNDVILAGQTGVAGHLHIGDGAVASGKAGITRDVPAGQHVSGHPAMEHRAYLRWQAALKQWPRWWQKLKQRPRPSVSE